MVLYKIVEKAILNDANRQCGTVSMITKVYSKPPYSVNRSATKYHGIEIKVFGKLPCSVNTTSLSVGTRRLCTKSQNNVKEGK